MDEAILERLKSEHGGVELHVITVDEHDIVVRMPTEPEFERFVAGVEKNGQKANRQLLRDCLVHPPRAELDALFARRPGLPLAFGKELARITGATLEATSKKA